MTDTASVTTHPPGLTDMQLIALHAQHHDRLPMWTIYQRPSDYPDGYVARMFFTLPRAEPTAVAIFGPTRDAVRAALPAGLHRISRSPGDDPCIVETWL